MALSQVQIIQSLAEALAWFEKELSWGVEPAELSHLTGRIGELYVAMTNRGQMALTVNQRGYDVISGENERISVKTITSSNHVDFRKSTFSEVDRVIVLRINVEEGEAAIEELFDLPAPDAAAKLKETDNGWRYAVSRAHQVVRDVEELTVIRSARAGNLKVMQYENLAIQVEENGRKIVPAKPALRELAREIGVDPLNSNGNPKNTRQLGADVVRALSD
jgi:hypothetical protein